MRYLTFTFNWQYEERKIKCFTIYLNSTSKKYYVSRNENEHIFTVAPLAFSQDECALQMFYEALKGI